MSEAPRESQILLTWREIFPLGRAIRSCTGRQWELSLQERQLLHDITSQGSADEKSESLQPTIVSWDGNNDVENPRNWSKSYKIWVVFLVSLYSFIVYCGAAIITPTYPQLTRRFALSDDVVPLTMSMYVLGYGIGPLLFSPLSEIPSIGRNPPYVISFAMFLTISIILGVLDSFPAIVVLRFLQGFFGSPCLATGGASIMDVYSGTAVSYGYVSWIFCLYFAPALGPLLSTKAVETLGWHWSMWQIAIMAAPLLVVLAFLLPETSHDAILLRRARRLRHLTHQETIMALCELQNSQVSLSAHVYNALIRPAKIAIKDTAVGFVCLYTSLIYAIFYSFFEVFPLVYPAPGMYMMTPMSYSLVFLSIIVGIAIGAVTYVVYLHSGAEALESALLDNRQEEALRPALIAVWLVTAGLLLFAWTARESIHWIVPTLGITIYGASSFVVAQALLVYIPHTYPQYVASLLAGNDFTRSTTAAVFIMVTPYMYRNLGISKGVTLVAGISVLGIIGIWVLWRYGRKMRARSKFAVGG